MYAPSAICSRRVARVDDRSVPRPVASCGGQTKNVRRCGGTEGFCRIAEITIAGHLLQDAGYRTAHIGNGISESPTPETAPNEVKDFDFFSFVHMPRLYPDTIRLSFIGINGPETGNDLWLNRQRDPIATVSISVEPDVRDYCLGFSSQSPQQKEKAA